MRARGVLILGKPASGKSETALELVSRGHALVADDIVVLRRCPAPHGARCGVAGLVASPDALLRGLLHIRDVGVIDVALAYGADRILSSCRIAVCVALDGVRNAILQAFPDDAENVATWLGITVPCYRLCATHSRAIPSIVEAIASGGVIGVDAVNPLITSWRKAAK